MAHVYSKLLIGVFSILLIGLFSSQNAAAIDADLLWDGLMVISEKDGNTEPFSAGQEIQISTNAMNQGTEASDLFRTRILIADPDGTVVQVAISNEGNLGPGQSTSNFKTTFLPEPTHIPGTYTVTINLDFQGAVSESDETNNILIDTFELATNSESEPDSQDTQVEEFIHLRTGNGLSSESDTEINFLSSDTQFLPTAQDFTDSCAGPSAQIVVPKFFWKPTLDVDGLAMWISDNADIEETSAAILYCHTFTVESQNFDDVWMDFHWIVDNILGDSGTGADGVYINGVPLGITGGNPFIENWVTMIDITSLITPGTNTLHVYSKNIGFVGGTIYTAWITVKSPDVPPSPEEFVHLQTGNGLSSESDTEINFLGGSDLIPTLQDFDDACAGPAAEIVAPHPNWLFPLPGNPAAQWISTDPNIEEHAPVGLYCHPFNVDSTTIDSAFFDIIWTVDNTLGADGGVIDGVYLNGVPLGIIGGNFFTHKVSFGNDVTGLLQTGTNTLHVYVRDLGVAGGVIYSAWVSINPVDTNPDFDGDGLSDQEEIALGTDPVNPDPDGDGVLDGDEIAMGTNPFNPDTDFDGVNDGDDLCPLEGTEVTGEVDADGCPVIIE